MSTRTRTKARRPRTPVENRGLPNGQFTTDTKEYVREWRRVGDCLAEIVGGTLWGFDPDVLIRDANHNEVRIPGRAAYLIVAALRRSLK